MLHILKTVLPVLQHGSRALHDVRETCKDEPPSRDQGDGVREAGAEAKVKVLNENLFESLKSERDD
jgi:hypothetical protein